MSIAIAKDETAKAPGTAKIAAVGMFDGVHAGHRYLLDELRREGERRGLEPLAVTFSNHPLEVVCPKRAPLLLTSAAEKEALIRAEGIGEVVCLPFDEALRGTSAEDFLRLLRKGYGVEALLMGFNNRFGHDAPRDFGAYRALGAEQGVEILPATEYRPAGAAAAPSSTAIRGALAEGRVEDAAAMLGRPYAVTGRVVHGRELGRRLGFPTANVEVAPWRQLPQPGVYAARCGGLPAMVNIGHRPTVDAPRAPLSVEAHIIGLPEGTDLYGRELTLEFARRLRGERRFGSLEELAAQLRRDREEATKG